MFYGLAKRQTDVVVEIIYDAKAIIWKYCPMIRLDVVDVLCSRTELFCGDMNMPIQSQSDICGIFTLSVVRRSQLILIFYSDFVIKFMVCLCAFVQRANGLSGINRLAVGAGMNALFCSYHSRR